MLQPHIKIDQINEFVLLPGDPGRIDTIVKQLNSVKEIKQNREYRTSEGKYKCIDISVVSTGIGCPSAAIAVEELVNIGAKRFIRIGTCGGLLKDMEPGDIIIPNAAACFDGTTSEYNKNITQIEADKNIVNALIKASIEASKKSGIKFFVGINRTHDAFYEPIENFVDLADKGFISSEMECSAVFLVSKLRNAQAGAILVVNTPEPPEEVKNNPEIIYRLIDQEKVAKGMKNAINIALEAIKILDKEKI